MEYMGRDPVWGDDLERKGAGFGKISGCENFRIDLLVDIGSMLKRERLYRNLSQKVVSERSGVSESALKNLEGGKGASLTTFIQVCRTLGKDEWIMRLGPADEVSIRDYAKRGNRTRVRASAVRKEAR